MLVSITWYLQYLTAYVLICCVIACLSYRWGNQGGISHWAKRQRSDKAIISDSVCADLLLCRKFDQCGSNFKDNEGSMTDSRAAQLTFLLSSNETSYSYLHCHRHIPGLECHHLRVYLVKAAWQSTYCCWFFSIKLPLWCARIKRGLEAISMVGRKVINFV